MCKVSIPDDIGNLTLSCKRIYTACVPFFEHHNSLRWHFRDFYYGKTNKPVKSDMEKIQFPNSISSSFNLIARIAVRNRLGGYIRPRQTHATTNRENSPYLKEAGLDWGEYCAAILEDHRQGRFSRHAMAFVLTLLPKVRDLTLPGRRSSAA